MQKFARILTVLAFTHAVTIAAAAEPYPSKPVKLIVPFAAGGGTDALARIVAQRLTDKWGQSLVVDNRPGAEGVIGSQVVAQSPPDGYTLLWAVPSHALNPAMRLNMPYDTLKAFAPIAMVAATPYVIVAGKKLDAKTMPELIAQAKTNPGRIGYGTNDAAGRIIGQLLKTGASIDIVDVPYKGSGPMLTDIVGGHVEIGFISLPSAMSYYKAGTLKLLGVTSAKRTRLAPDLPTMMESGVKDFDVMLWWGIMGPAGTPAEIQSKIHRDLVELAADREFRESLSKAGAEPVITSPQDFSKFFREEVANASAMVKAAGIKPE